MMRSAAALPFRDRLRELKRATHLLAAIDPPDDASTLEMRVSGLCGDGLDLPVEVGNVIAAIHVVDARLVVLVAPTELPVGDGGTSFELEAP